jgi:hypothetical protein
MIIIRMDEEKKKTAKAKKVVEETASITIKVTATVVKIIFILIIIYTVAAAIFLFTSDREPFLTNMATVSVGGFWAFFLGYFGWRMGQTIELYFHDLKKNK